MATELINGQRRWGVTRDEKGHRTYKITHLVKALTTDGPFAIANTPGLPLPGSFWNFDGDVDAWAFCKQDLKATTLTKNEPNQFWEVEQTFTSKPGDSRQCKDETIEDPLLVPDGISGGFVRYTEERPIDKNNNPIKNSSHEMATGPQVEFDVNRPTVRIVQNRIGLELSLITSQVDTLNDAALWGLSAAKIKLSNFSWSRELYGVCNFYYVRIFDFDVNFDGWSRDITDEGTMVLNGHHDITETTGTGPDQGTGTGTDAQRTGWVVDNIGGAAPDATNPQHFVKYKDLNGENARILLDGAGLPLDDDSNPVITTFDHYQESNFLLLGIPTSL